MISFQAALSCAFGFVFFLHSFLSSWHLLLSSPVCHAATVGGEVCPICGSMFLCVLSVCWIGLAVGRYTLFLCVDVTGVLKFIWKRFRLVFDQLSQSASLHPTSPSRSRLEYQMSRLSLQYPEAITINWGWLPYIECDRLALHKKNSSLSKALQQAHKYVYLLQIQTP